MLQKYFHSLIPNLLYFLVAAGVLTFCACTGSAQKENTSPKADERVVFEDRVEAEYAGGFRISYHENYKLLEILNPYQDMQDTLRYLLKPRGVNLDASVITGNAQVIEIPIRSMIATSTTHIALTNMLEANEIIVGMAGARYIYNPQIKEKVDSGEVVSFNEGEFNKEQALAMGPDLVMVSAGQSSQFDDYKVLMDSGIGVFINSEWLETTPLGKAEWVKVMAAFLNKEAIANEKFSRVEERYLELRQKVQNVDQKPLVINNMPYKGAWFVSGGNSFEAVLLKDARADYPWFDEKSAGGLRKDFEVIYEIGLDAEVWINTGAAATRAEILEKDTRFRDFKAFRTGRIYNNNRRMSPAGGNDYWESGVVHPERLLADLIHIMHPERLPDHDLYYYQKLNNNE